MSRAGCGQREQQDRAPALVGSLGGVFGGGLVSSLGGIAKGRPPRRGEG